MSAYQGKVDTILKRRDEGTSFKTIMETALAQGEQNHPSPPPQSPVKLWRRNNKLLPCRRRIIPF
jgi:hypothetical protein